jgi:hypothetical protein
VVEHNGFTLADFTEQEIVLRLYGWKTPQPPEAIDRLEPHFTETLR